MRKTAAMLLACLLLPVSAAALAENSTTPPTPDVVQLETGEVQVYELGDNRLHAYVSGDALGDTCYAVESPEGIVLIESTAFSEQNTLWKRYIDTLGKEIAGMFMAFHPNGSQTYGDAEPYATQNALMNWGESGSIRALTDGFAVAFGDSVAQDITAQAQLVGFGDMVHLAGLDFIIRNEGDDAYGLEIPALGCVYIHMLGSKTHNILTSTAHIDAFKAELEGFDYDLVLTSHHAPEGRAAVAEKIAYLTKTREIAENSADAGSFIAAMNEAFPDYDGANYLDMTAGFLFPSAQ